MARTIYATGRITWHENQIRILLSGEAGETSAEIRRRARAVQKRAQRGVRSRSGRLVRSISVSTRYPPEGAAATISATAEHAMAVERGRREVRPVNRTWLHWQGDYGPVFTQHAGPADARPYMRPALDEAAGDG